MKKILLIICLIAPIWSCAQSVGTAIFTIDNGTINSNSGYIDSPYNDPDMQFLTYTGQNPIDIMAGNTSYIVKPTKFTGWENERIYSVIEVSKNNNVVFVYKYWDGFTTFNDPINLDAPRLRQYADNDYFIKVALSNEATALIFVGWPYASDPEQLFIVVLTPDDVKVVYNKPMIINSITQSGYNFSMITQSNVLEEGIGTPITHTIYQQDGVLYFKDN
jgi:hypothetical protein